MPRNPLATAARPGARPVRPPRTVLNRVRAGLSTVPALLAIAPALRWLVAVHAVPPGAARRSRCDACGAPIRLTGPYRALSPLARCSGCAARIGASPFAVEAAGLLAVAAVLAANRTPVEMVAFAWWLACAVPLVFIDVAVHRLPDRLTWPAAAGALGLLGAAALVGGDGADGTAWRRALLAGAGAALLLAATALLFGSRGFGLGDAKLALSAVGILGWLGWPALFAGLLVTTASSAVVSVVLLATGRIRWRGHLPFGPFLVLGTLAALAGSAG